MTVNTSSILSLVALMFYGGLVWAVLSSNLRSWIIRSFSLYLAAMILWSFGAFMLFGDFRGISPLFWNRFMVIGSMAMPVAFFGFTHAFLMRDKRNWQVVGYFLYLLMMIANAAGYLVTAARVIDGQLTSEYGSAFIPAMIVWVFFIGFSMVDLFYEYRKTKVAFYRDQIKYLLVTTIVIFAGMLISLTGWISFPVDITFNIAAAALISYAILRHQLLDIAIVVRKGLLYSIPTIIIGIAYFLIVYLALGVFHSTTGAGIFLLSVLVAVLAVLIGEPLGSAVKHGVDRLFYRENYNSTQMLQRLSRTAVSVLDLDAITRLILNEVTSTMHIRHAGFFLKKEPTGDYYLMAQAGMDVGAMKLTRKHPLITYFNADQQALTNFDLDAHPHFLALWRQEKEELAKIKAQLFIPLKAKGDLVGIFAVGPRQSGEPFSQDDQLTLGALANQTASAIENALLFAGEARRRREAETLQKVLTELTSDLDLKQVLDTILVQLEKVIPYDSACVFLLQKDRLFAAAARGFARVEEVINRDYPVEGDKLFLELQQTRRPVILSDAQADAWFKGYGGTQDARSRMGVPLILQGTVIGYLTLDSFTPAAYNELEQADLAQAFASHAAVAVENARLFKVEHEQRKSAEALREVGTMLSSTLDFDRVLDLLLDQVGRVMPYDLANILLSDGNSHLRVVRTRLSEIADPFLARHIDDALFEISDTPNLQQMIESGRPMVIPDIAAYPGWVQRVPFPARSWAGVPVFSNDQMVACFSLVKFETNFYNAHHADLLAIFAGQAALALQNARLFTEVQQLAIIDDLTGLFNRRHLFELGKREFNRAQRFHRPLSVVMLDLDYFRNVNDIHAHLTGDQVLRLVAERCKASIREVDVIGRYGGDEFTIICPESSLEEAQTVSERLRKNIGREPFMTPAGPVNLTASLGIAVMTPETPDLITLVDWADKAMYVSKHNGRDLVTGYVNAIL
jgi:diguanylate cyclase (GGDEF)-like protein